LKVTFLGTSAAHSNPLPFCNCGYCSGARIIGGKNLRKRSSILINDDLIIDLGPDFMTASFTHNIDTAKINYWLQTHSHSDHFSSEHIITRMTEYAVKDVNPLLLFASLKCIKNISEKLGKEEFGVNLFEEEWLNLLSLKINSLEYFAKSTFGDYSVTAFDANHDYNDGSSIYLISNNNLNVFYGLDTNGISDNVWDYLRNNRIHLDIIILDHTYGHNINANDHLNANKFIECINLMEDKGCISNKTKIYASHISHEGNLLHDEFEVFANNHRYSVAYDGLIIDI